MNYEQFTWWLSGYLNLENGNLATQIKEQMARIEGFSPAIIQPSLEESVDGSSMEAYLDTIPLEDENLASVGDLIDPQDLEWRPAHGKA